MGFELMLPPSPSMTKTSLGRFSLNQTPLRHEGGVDGEESLMFAVFSFTWVGEDDYGFFGTLPLFSKF